MCTKRDLTSSSYHTWPDAPRLRCLKDDVEPGSCVVYGDLSATSKLKADWSFWLELQMMSRFEEVMRRLPTIAQEVLAEVVMDAGCVDVKAGRRRAA